MSAALRRYAPGLAAVAALLAWGGASSADEAKVRGVVISTHTDGREWGWDSMGSTIDSIREVGAGWISTHPYAVVRADGSVRFHDFDPENPPAHLVRPIAEAHRRGLKILIKPHLAYWGSPFSWRGEIGFEREEQWQRFFEDYERWIVKVARACRDADGFAVGTELGRTLAHAAEWRGIIGRVRSVSGAALTYAANWDEYETVPFWDALDAIGIQAYFPLTEDDLPDEAELGRAWRARMEQLSGFARRHNRKVVFTEIGYTRSFDAARRPWDPRIDGPEAEAFQARCLQAALRAIESEPWVVGAFLWKWFPDPYPVGRDFQLATPRLKRAIVEVWASPG